MNKIYIYFWLPLSLMFLACGTKQETSAGRADSLTVDSSRIDSSGVVKFEKYSGNVPAWFRRQPQKEGALYARGTAVSANRTVAEEKALFKAQKELAALLKEQRPSGGAGAKAARDETVADNTVDLSGYRILKQQKFREGSKWRVYLLLELDMSD